MSDRGVILGIEHQFGRIDHTTLTPAWYGERLDPQPILDALLPNRIPAAA